MSAYSKTSKILKDMAEHAFGSGEASKAADKIKSRSSKVDKAVSDATGEDAPAAKPAPKKKYKRSAYSAPE